MNDAAKMHPSPAMPALPPIQVGKQGEGPVWRRSGEPSPNIWISPNVAAPSPCMPTHMSRRRSTSNLGGNPDGRAAQGCAAAGFSKQSALCDDLLTCLGLPNLKVELGD